MSPGRMRNKFNIYVHAQCLFTPFTDGAQLFRIPKGFTVKQVANHVIKNSMWRSSTKRQKDVERRGMVARYAPHVGGDATKISHHMRLKNVIRTFGFQPNSTILYLWFPSAAKQQ